MSDGWLGFLGGILTALVGALIASIVQRQTERKRRKEQAQLDTYFHLVELKNWYFWIATAELHNEEPNPEVLGTCRNLAYQLTDKLRSFDDVEHVEEILTVLFGESIPTANDRAKKLDALLDRYGELVNPTYTQAIRRISRENLLRHGPGKMPSSNAPGSWSY